MELEQKWNANPRDLGACGWGGMGVGRESGDRSLGTASPHYLPSPSCTPCPPETLPVAADSSVWNTI